MVEFNIYLQPQEAEVLEKTLQQNEKGILQVLFPLFEERVKDRKGKEELSRLVEEGEFIKLSSWTDGNCEEIYKREENKEDLKSPGRSE